MLNILPAETADELKRNGKAKARRFENVTVLFSDIVNFSSLSENLPPEELVSEIDDYFSIMDALVKASGLEKIKTIGDAYLCVGGLPSEDPKHAIKAVSLAMKMQEAVVKRNVLKRSQNKPAFEIRIGLNSGPVVAGVVGTYKFVYDIWGDTVNTAARMESTGEPGKVNISETTYSLLEDHFLCTPRGKIEAKNKGTLEMYFVDKERIKEIR